MNVAFIDLNEAFFDQFMQHAREQEPPAPVEGPAFTPPTEFEEYRLIRPIGQGAMGQVYLAHHQMLRRPCAVKLIRPEQAGSEEWLRRFEREARTLSLLQHENIVHVYDFQKLHGALFIVMELVEGIDLYDLLEKTPVLPVRSANTTVVLTPMPWPWSCCGASLEHQPRLSRSLQLHRLVFQELLEAEPAVQLVRQIRYAIGRIEAAVAALPPAFDRGRLELARRASVQSEAGLRSAEQAHLAAVRIQERRTALQAQHARASGEAVATDARATEVESELSGWTLLAEHGFAHDIGMTVFRVVRRFVIAAALGWVGWSIFRKAAGTFRRSRDEFVMNMQWVKSSLKREQ